MGKLDGKVILLGGGLGSIKKEKFAPDLSIGIAKKLIEEGAQLIVTDVDANVVQNAVAEIGGNCKGIPCDLLKDRTSEEKENG